MGKKSKKRRFYPEFYSDDEYKDMIKKNDVQHRENIYENAEDNIGDAPHAEGAEYGMRIDYSEQELTDIYSRLNGTEGGGKKPDSQLEDFRNNFIEENKKFSALSPDNPLKRIETYPDAESPRANIPDIVRTGQSVREAEPENGGYIPALTDESEYEAVTEETMILNNSEAANEPEENGAFSGDYIDPGEEAENIAYAAPHEKRNSHEEEYEKQDNMDNVDNMDNFSDHHIAPGETIEYAEETYGNLAEPAKPADLLEYAESPKAVETMEYISSPQTDIPPVAFPPVVTEEIPYIIPNDSQNAAVKPYDREAAVKYAHRWALDRNPEYYDYDEIGGDCTNYVSQILFAGGCAMDLTPTTGWYYKSANLKSPSWTGVEQLYNFLTGEKVTGPVGREVDISEAEPGDLVNLSFNGKTYQHCPVIVKVKKSAGVAVSPKDIFICAHSYDCENRPLDTYTWKKMRFIKIVGTK